MIVGMQNEKDLRFVQNNPLPDAKVIGKSLMTEANFSFLTTLDNSVSLPIAVNYLPKSVSGDDMYDTYKNIIQVVQVCQTVFLSLVQHSMF